MSVADIDELLFRYDKLRSFSNSGSMDNWFNAKFKLAKVFKWRPMQVLYRKTYDLPIARNKMLREIRTTLVIIKRLHQINHFRANKTDGQSKQAIEIITKYLDTAPKPDDFLKKLSVLKFPASFIPGITSFLFTHGQDSASMFWTIVLIGISLTLVALSYVVPELGTYILEIYWYKKCVKDLDIVKLKEKIIDDLIRLNNKTFYSLSDHQGD